MDDSDDDDGTLAMPGVLDGGLGGRRRRRLYTINQSPSIRFVLKYNKKGIDPIPRAMRDGREFVLKTQEIVEYEDDTWVNPNGVGIASTDLHHVASTLPAPPARAPPAAAVASVHVAVTSSAAAVLVHTHNAGSSSHAEPDSVAVPTPPVPSVPGPSSAAPVLIHAHRAVPREHAEPNRVVIWGEYTRTFLRGICTRPPTPPPRATPSSARAGGQPDYDGAFLLTICPAHLCGGECYDSECESTRCCEVGFLDQYY